MNISALRMGCVAIGLLAPVTFTMKGANRLPLTEQGHVSGLVAKITTSDGITRTAKLEGVGCSDSMCSRTSIKGRAENGALARAWFDRVSAIRDTTEAGALFVMKDGTQRRLALVPDFRVLYLTNASGAEERLDLAKVKSIEF